MRLAIVVYFSILGIFSTSAVAQGSKACTSTNLSFQSQIPVMSRDNLIKLRKLASDVQFNALVAMAKYGTPVACILLLAQAVDVQNAVTRELVRRDKH